MRKALLMFAGSLFLVLLVSCKEKHTNVQNTDVCELVTIDIVNNLHKETPVLNLSDAASTVEIVPLEFTENSLVTNHFFDLIITENDIILPFYRNILRFARDGKFLNKIGNHGQGPEDFVNVMSVSVNEQEQELFVLTMTGLKVYDFDGSFKRDIAKFNPEIFFNSHLPGIVTFKDKLFMRDQLPILFPKEELWSFALMDTSFNIQKKFYNPDYHIYKEEIFKEEHFGVLMGWKNYWIEQETNMDYYGNDFKVKYHGVDTIYIFEESELEFKPAWSLELGKSPSFDMSHWWIKDREFFKYLWIYEFYDTKDFLYLLAGKNEQVYTIRFDKDKGEVCLRKDNSEIRERGFGDFSDFVHKRLERSFKLTNDISGGGDFVVDYKSLNNTWVSVNYATDILEKIDMEELRKEKVKDEAARERLVNVLTGLSEEDNPVLIIANLK